MTLRSIEFPEMRMRKDDDTAIACFGTIRQQVSQPFRLFGAQSTIRAVQTDEQIQFVPAVGRLEPIGTGMEEGAVYRPLLKIDVVVTGRNEERTVRQSENTVGTGKIILCIYQIA